MYTHHRPNWFKQWFLNVVPPVHLHGDDQKECTPVVQRSQFNCMARHELGWEGTHRYSLTFWPEIGPKDLLVIGGCIGVDPDQEGSVSGNSLSWRFSDAGSLAAHACKERLLPGVRQQKWHMHACKERLPLESGSKNGRALPPMQQVYSTHLDEATSKFNSNYRANLIAITGP